VSVNEDPATNEDPVNIPTFSTHCCALSETSYSVSRVLKHRTVRRVAQDRRLYFVFDQHLARKVSQIFSPALTQFSLRLHNGSCKK
jgi:hypothetical protein